MSDRKIITFEQFATYCGACDENILDAMPCDKEHCKRFNELQDAELIIDAAKSLLEINKTSPWLDELRDELNKIKELE